MKNAKGIKQTKGDRSQSETSLDLPEKLEENLVSSTSAFFERSLRRAFEMKREFFVAEIVARLGEISLRDAHAEENSTPAGEWIEIESLSKLRQVVGGRFHNIKKKWVDAGFPLREHRGDREAEFKVDEKGWIELSNWISKQGFEARLTPDKAECLFELRALASSEKSK